MTIAQLLHHHGNYGSIRERAMQLGVYGGEIKRIVENGLDDLNLLIAEMTRNNFQGGSVESGHARNPFGIGAQAETPLNGETKPIMPSRISDLPALNSPYPASATATADSKDASAEDLKV